MFLGEAMANVMTDFLSSVGHLALVFIFTALGVLFHERFRELARDIERYRIGRWLLAPLRLLERVLAMLGIVSPRGQLPITHWAGMVSEDRQICEECGDWLSRRAKAWRDRLLSGEPTESKRVFMLSYPGSGEAELAREVYRILRREREVVFFFDCSSMSRGELPQKFVENVASWTRIGLQRDHSLRLLDLRLFFFRHRFRTQKRQAAAIICHAERLLESDGDGEGEAHFTIYRHCSDILDAFLVQSGLPVLLTLDSTSFALDREPISSAIQEWRERGEKTDLLMESHYVDRLLERLGLKAVLGGSWKYPISLDNFEVLAHLAGGVDDPGGFLRTARDLPEQLGLSSYLFDKSLELSAVRFVEGIGRHVSSVITEIKKDIGLLASAMGLLDCPVPATSIRTLWSSCGVDDDGLLGDEPEPSLSIPIILELLVEFQIAKTVRKEDEIARQTVYLLRPAFRNITREILAESAPALKDQMTLAVYTTLADLEPPGITPVSRYLSEADFRPTQDLLGYIQSQGGEDVLHIPLPPEICSTIDSVRSGVSLPQCILRIYRWSDRSGREHADLVGVISPIEFCQAHRIVRISAHIVSREGTGRQVQRALQPFIGEFILVEGDAYRCGPGGCLEILAVISGETSIDEIRRSVAAALQHGVDDYADLNIVNCTPRSVVEDFACHTEDIPGGLTIEESGPTIYGPASRYILAASGTGLSVIRKMLSSSGAEVDVNDIRVMCVYSLTSAQVFFALKPLDLRKQVRAQVSSLIEQGRGIDHVTLRFMDVAEERINLLKLRHGPGNSYLVDFEIPPASATVEGTDAELGKYARQVVEQFSTDLSCRGVGLSAINGIASVFSVGEESGGNNDRSFGTGAWIKHGVYDLVASPEMFHRFMRKHLFIPDSDAAAVALCSQFLSGKSGDYRVLEIGSGTGALSEKLILAGINRIDTVEPDKKLSDFWVQLREARGLQQHGTHYQLELEELRATSSGKYDLLVSQGLHHHVPERRCRADRVIDSSYRFTFLEICREFLHPDGAYILSDEFVIDYATSLARREVLDRWYRHVIASALADGYPELADMEFRFWMNDQSETTELKESVGRFKQRLVEAGESAPFSIESVTRFGLTDYYGGGFAVLFLRPRWSG
jgi:SAM-dependent methyltransferase